MAHDDQLIIYEAVRLQERKLKSYLRRRLRDKQDAEDIFQEMVFRLLERSRRVPLLDPVAYAFRVLDNLMRDARRHTAAHEALDEGTPCGEGRPDAVLESREIADLMAAEIARMPDLRREVFIQRRLHGRSYDDIAKQMNLSAEAVQKHYSRAAIGLKKIYESLGQQGDAE